MNTRRSKPLAATTGYVLVGANVRPGGRVMWSNISPAHHTVTSD